MTDTTDTPKAPPTREQTARAEIGRTRVSPAVARTLAACFLVVIVAVPAARFACELLADASRLPQPLEAFRLLPAAVRAYQHKGGSTVENVLAANAATLRNIDHFAAALEDGSPQDRFLRPHVQAYMTCWAGLGTEQAYVGRQGWLFYRPDIDHVTGAGFLDRRHLAWRRVEGNEYTAPPQGDPRKAILQFHARLGRQGIRLVVVPTPLKPMIHGEKFSSRFDARGGVQANPSFEQFRQALEAAGVLVFDPAPILAEARARTGRDQFLRCDTHWTPEAMDLVAARLARFVAGRVELVPYRLRLARAAETVSGAGDIAAMLGLPDGRRLFGPQTVEIRPVLDTGGTLLWRPRKDAAVLLLGDSFTNVYSLEAMGWGHTAGLAEQLSFHMKRPIDRIARNDDGAFATRAALVRELAAGRDRLAGKKVVIWQFAARELSAGDWKLIDMTVGKPRPSNFIVLEAGSTRVVTATVSDVSPVPRPGSVPYRDHICQIHLTDLEDESGKPIPGREALVFMWSMRSKVLTPAGRYRQGQSVRLRIRAWEGVPERLHGRVNRSEFDDDEIADILGAPLCWGEEVRP